MKTSLVWFRNDLRLEDNQTLDTAIRESDNVLPVYILDPRQFTSTIYNFPKTGDVRKKFIYECLNDLKTNLQKIGGDLIITEGIPEELIPELAKSFGIQKVYFSEEATTEERAVEQRVEIRLGKLGIETEKFWTSTLICKSDLPFSIPHIPDVFTKFRSKIEHETKYSMPLEAPIAINLHPDFQKIDSIELAENFENVKIDERSVLAFSGGETKAKSRLRNYIWEEESIRNYKEVRNGLIGSSYSTKFSPWLATGCLSAKTIASEVDKYETMVCKNDSTYWVKFELLWRDFFRFTALRQGSRLFDPNGFNGLNVKPGKTDFARLKKWINGETGDAFVDANMRELAATGWMSNRGRQNVASYLIHDMQVNWLLGAAYFESQLIDYDPCSNYGNWAYIAGVGNDPRPIRKFNTIKQAQDYDPQGAYRKLWSKGSSFNYNYN